MSRRGLSLIEVLVVLGVIALLMALLIPAVQSAREAARRTQCQANLKQIGLALHQYHEVFQMFPRGNSYRYSLSLHAAILPYIDQKALYDAYRSKFPDDQATSSTNTQVIKFLAQHSIPLFVCPSDAAVGNSRTNYVGNFGTGVQTYGYNGVFENLLEVKDAEITDGLSQTAAMSEWLIGDADQFALSRNIWSTPYRLTGADQLEQFAHLCRRTATSGVQSDIGKGNVWPNGQVGSTMYNHILFPNDASCRNGTLVQEGAYSASSLHHGMVHVLAADGHVRPVSSQVDLSIWRALGSRNGGEVVSLP